MPSFKHINVFVRTERNLGMELSFYQKTHFLEKKTITIKLQLALKLFASNSVFAIKNGFFLAVIVLGTAGPWAESIYGVLV